MQGEHHALLWREKDESMNCCSRDQACHLPDMLILIERAQFMHACINGKQVKPEFEKSTSAGSSEKACLRILRKAVIFK
jgi:hypothetical protein